MMELSIIWSILIAQIMLGLAMAFAFFRMVRGPRAQKRQPADENGSPDGKVGEVAHSMISPRIRNLPKAIDDTKPISATISADSK